MSTVEQIHHLETHIERVLFLVRDLRSANASLREEVTASEGRSAELQSRLSASESAREESDRKRQELEERLSHLRSEQEEIAATINRTLEQLGRLDLGGTEGSDEEESTSDNDSEAVPQTDEPKLFDAADESEDAGGETASDEAQSDDSDQPGADEADAEERNPEHSEGSEFDIF